jgi:hypothetical protein
VYIQETKNLSLVWESAWAISIIIAHAHERTGADVYVSFVKQSGKDVYPWGISQTLSFLFSYLSYCTLLQVILTPTCRVSGYPRQVIRVEVLRQLRFIWTALPTVITLITIIPLGTYNTSSWYIFLFSLMTAVCLSLS